MELQDARPRHPRGVGQASSAFTSMPLPSACAPVWLVCPLGSSMAHSRNSEETFFLFGYDGVAWLENNFAS